MQYNHANTITVPVFYRFQGPTVFSQ